MNAALRDSLIRQAAFEGERAAECYRNRDVASATFHHENLSRIVNAADIEDRAGIRTAFREAYAASSIRS